MKIESWAIEKLIPYAKNPRKNDQAVETMAAAIREFGFRVPVIVKSDGEIVDGHLRLKAAVAAGLTEVPVILADDLSEAQIKAFRLSVNKTAELAEWDFELLKEELSVLEDMDYDLSLIGFSDEDLTDILFDKDEGLTDPNDIPPLPADPVSQPGDVWIMGNHRLMCGDSTDMDLVAKLMGDSVFKLLFTSPPYGDRRDYGKIQDWDFLMNGVFLKLDKFSNPDVNVIVNLGLLYKNKNLEEYYADWIVKMKEAGWNYFDQLIWDKIQPAPRTYLGRTIKAHEFLFVFTLNDGRINKTKDSKQQNPRKFKLETAHVRQKDGSFKTRVSRGKSLNKITQHSVLSIMCQRGPSDGDHPAVFPIALPEKIMEMYTAKGDCCYEPFCGSGTSIVAAENTGRKCFGMELAPEYVDIAVARWQRFTGKKAVLEGGGGRSIE